MMKQWFILQWKMKDLFAQNTNDRIKICNLLLLNESVNWPHYSTFGEWCADKHTSMD